MRPDRARAALLLAACAIAAVRIGEAFAGLIAPVCAAGELAAVATAAALAALALPRLERRAPAIAVGLMLFAWTGGVGWPLWRLAHPEPPLYDATMGGATREVTTLPARGGRYRIQLEPVGGGARQGPYQLHVGAGAGQRGFGGVLDDRAAAIEIALLRGEAARLYFERMPGFVAVRVGPVPPPGALVAIGGALAALMALALEATGRRRRLHGLLTSVVAASALFAALALPDAVKGGWFVIAAALLALAGGGLAGSGAAAAAFALTTRLRRRMKMRR